MNKLLMCGNGYKIDRKILYSKVKEFPERILYKCFDFAYDMTYAELGEHRNYRSGGTLNRKNGEIFINTFQGKLAEYSIWNEFANRKLEINRPDLEKFKLGKWDDFDFIYKNYKIAVKSTKHYGNLLLLERKDWNNEGIYIPNEKKGTGYYDFFVLIRIFPDGERIMKDNRILYSKNIDKKELEEKIINKDIKWSYDIPGFITHADFCEVIENRNIIEKGSMLNGKIEMDANNYYVQAGDMKNINEMFKEITGINIKEIDEIGQRDQVYIKNKI